jgi:DnaJ family protein C protein 28
VPNIEEIIRKAMEEGAFENLRGQGQPLDLDTNPYVDSGWELAYHLLKENGFAPQFIEMRQAIETELAAARAALARSAAWRQQALAAGEDAARVEAELAKAKEKFTNSIEELNKRILTYNLSIPLPSLHRNRIDLQAELANFLAQ